MVTRGRRKSTLHTTHVTRKNSHVNLMYLKKKKKKEKK